MHLGKCNLKSEVQRWCPGVPRGCVHRIHLWPLMYDDHSGVLICACETKRPDWPARVLANGVSTRIDRQPACEKRSIARVQGQMVTSCFICQY